ncbi:LysR-family transcriptional regulator (H-NS-dependent flhD regulator) [Escherichia coli]|uniref:LysR-family transcriptional regulator (H-NS-dependent flhD regulator) n=1 Tax=Escherichia coli TaxID=562 RepID=A0A376VV12_ECOLX|nr:LysR-family transcriptional regulator (H-NS-dependent flhD regulator) [Escherichia coli]
MDTELLKTFLEVSRTRHFGRAAESLYLTQSAVSFRIRQLENQLGVNLFHPPQKQYPFNRCW